MEAQVWNNKSKQGKEKQKTHAQTWSTQLNDKNQAQIDEEIKKETVQSDWRAKK